MNSFRAGHGLVLLMCGLVLAATRVSAAEPVIGAGAAHPGKALYEKYCSACHDKPDLTRAVPFAQLKNMRLGNLFFAMSDGKMKEQAKATERAPTRAARRLHRGSAGGG